MADYTAIKNLITDVVKANGEQEITGTNLQNVLVSMINAVDSSNNEDFARISNTIISLLNHSDAEDADIRDDMQELASRLDTNRYGYNVTVFGLVAGVHTLATAVKNVPPAERFGGQKITFKTDAGWVTYQNTSLSADNYEDVVNWVLDSGVNVEGDVTITNNPDYEDLTQNTQNELKFADKEYNAATFSGLGRVYLRKNIVDNVNTLTQAMLADENTIYIIQYDYDLDEETIQLPQGAHLLFIGGSINNGTILLADGVSITGKSTSSNLVISYADDCSDIEIKGIEFIGDGTKNYAIGISGLTRLINNVKITECKIHGYKSGIFACVANAIIDNNIIYGCGGDSIDPDGVDIRLQYSITAGEIGNIIITNNLLLSGRVDNHVLVGQIYAETHIIISNNVCVAMLDDLSAEVTSSVCRHCIQVGYASTSTNRDKSAIISNNFCKTATWGAIYVRATNDATTINQSKYLVNISNNVIYNIITDGLTHICYAIAVEIQAGSIIQGNIIKNSTGGISCGVMYSDMDALVVNNTMDVIVDGVVIDTYCKRIQVQNNQIKAGNMGIRINPTSAGQTQDLYNNRYEITGNSVDAKVGIHLWNVTTQFVSVRGNNIVLETQTSDSIGIQCNLYQVVNVNISDNQIRNFNNGIYVSRAGRRQRNYIISHNMLKDCNVGIYMTNPSGAYWLLVFDNRFFDCVTNKSNGVYDGYYDYAGRAVIFGENSGSILGGSSQFVKGDRIYFTGEGWTDIYKCAICVTSTTLNDGTPVAGTAVWEYIEARGTASNRNALGNITAGQMFFNTSVSQPQWWQGSKWIKADGTDA